MKQSLGLTKYRIVFKIGSYIQSIYMDVYDDPEENERVRISNEKRINEVIAENRVKLLQDIAEIRASKTLACSRIADRHSSSRIEITELDLRVLEDVLDGKTQLKEFWSALKSLSLDIHYMLVHADENLDSEENLQI